MASQALEKARSAPGNGMASDSSEKAFASLADPAQAPSTPDAPQIERPEMTQQAAATAEASEAAATDPEPTAEAPPAGRKLRRNVLKSLN
jgi:hypothetical protein